MKEIWEDIKGYEGYYMVSSYGRVKSIGGRRGSSNKPKILKQGTDTSGYKMVIFRVNKHSKTFKVHRLVAETFIPNPNNLPEVNHKDEDKTNNCVDNLEYCDRLYNIRYGTGIERSAEKRKGIAPWNKNKKMDKTSCEKMSISRTGKGNWKSKPVCQYSLDDILINVFESANIAAKETNSMQAHISDCCNGKRKKHNGYIWKYKEESVA